MHPSADFLRLCPMEVVQARDFAEAVTPIKSEAMKTMLHAVESPLAAAGLSASMFAIFLHVILESCGDEAESLFLQTPHTPTVAVGRVLPPEP